MNAAELTKMQLMQELTALRQQVAALTTCTLERRRAQEEFIHFSSAIQMSIDSIVLTDIEGKIIEANDATLAMYGTTDKGDLIGKSAFELIAPDDRPRAFAGMGEVLEKGYIKSREYRVISKSGSTIPVEMSAALVKDVEGNLLGFVGINRDITERKRAEEEKQQLHEQLFQAQKLEAIGTLAGGVAHDFNNLLSSIVGFTELAADDALEGSLAHRNLEQVLNASHRAKVLVQQLLTFSRFSPHERQLIQLSPLVEETLNFLRVSLPETIEFRSHIAAMAGAVWTDPTQVQQILMNLCINAAQAMEERGGVLEVSLKRVEVEQALAHLHHNLKPGPHLRLTVSDTGHGMAQEAMQRIFEPFFTTKPLGAGSGLGLAVVHGIVTSHGGAITVESDPGQGTTFHVYLPLVETTATAEDVPSEIFL